MDYFHSEMQNAFRKQLAKVISTKCKT